MIKFLYFTDAHIRGSNPKSRKDNFQESLKEKFSELVDISINEKIDYVLFGGDLFERPDISLSVVKDFIKQIMLFKKPIYAISGNHDVFGQNPSTIGRTIMGILDTVGLINLINKDEKVYIEKDGTKVQLTGCPYYYDIDIDKTGYMVTKENCDVAINIVHGFLLDKPFIDSVEYTLIDEIADKTSADITICGHYHSGFGIKKVDDKYFVNPGSLARVSNVSSEMKRTPSCLIICVDNNQIDLKVKKLKCAKPGSEVFDKQSIKDEEYRLQRLNEFIHQVNTYGDFEILNVEKIIVDISTRENIPKNIKEEALRRITDAQIKLSCKGGLQ